MNDLDTHHEPLNADYMRNMLQGIPVALIACDPEGTILASNEAATREFDLRRKMLTGHNIRSGFPEHDQIRIDNIRKECLKKITPLNFHVSLKQRDEYQEYEVWITPVVDADGSVQGLTYSFQEIHLPSHVLRALDKQSRLNSLGSLAGAVAHHYNNLLCSIATAVDYANNMNTMSAMKRALGRVSEPIDRAAQISRELLAFAQADHRSSDMADLTECVLYFCDEHEESLARQHITLTLNWFPVPVFPVPRDSMMILLTNLVKNAVEAMRGGGEITIDLSLRDEHNIALIITDTGPGIPREMMDHLFEPFYTTKGELSCTGCGAGRNTGLGLAVVHGVVSAMHGTITAANAPGGGARFEMLFPAGGNAAND
ncbi:MAG: nitrogen regulation protein NR(II) [Phycisphaerae bacterium]